MTSDPDSEIRERLRAGEPSALALIYDRYALSLHAYAATVAGRMRADDVLQDVFVAIAERRTLVAQADNLPAYLMRMVRNRALDLVRRSGARELPLDAGGEPQALESPTDEPSTDAAAVAAALARLPLEQREVVALKVEGGLTFAAIAEVLGIPMNTAASRYRYALEKLQNLLSGESHVA